MEDELYLPYVEPRILHHHYPVGFAEGPSMQREDRKEYLKLAQKWDGFGLLGLVSQPPTQQSYTRIFNARKDERWDRQIGDRRRANMIEFPISGPSKYLLGGYLLCNLHVRRTSAPTLQ